MGGSSRSAEPRASSTEAVAIVLVVALVGSAVPAGATVLDGPGSELPLLVDETVDGGAALSVSLALDGPALYRIDVLGDGPRQGTAVSMGLVDFDANRSYDGMFAVTTFRSQERQRTVVANDAMPAPAYSVPDDGQALAAVLPDEEDQQRACPMACASRLEQPDRTEAGTYHHGVWMAGTDETRVQIVGDANVTDVELRTGIPFVAGSEAFERGAVNVQHQPTTKVGDRDAFAGSKAVHGAEHAAEVTHALYGVTGVTEFKTACAGECASTETVRGACQLAIGPDCRAAHIAWEGPEASGETSHHVFRGANPGTYTFTLERMADAYAADTPSVADYAYVDPGEHQPYVGGADLPQPPVLD